MKRPLRKSCRSAEKGQYGGALGACYRCAITGDDNPFATINFFAQINGGIDTDFIHLQKFTLLARGCGLQQAIQLLGVSGVYENVQVNIWPDFLQTLMQFSALPRCEHNNTAPLPLRDCSTKIGVLAQSKFLRGTSLNQQSKRSTTASARLKIVGEYSPVSVPV